jgi:hypothetical protein
LPVDPITVRGVDFSGASDAGRHAWASEATVEDGVLVFEHCFPIENLPRSGRSRSAALTALVTWLGESSTTTGMDAPFGLPRALVAEESWDEFVMAFGNRYSSANAFRQTCASLADGAELKRVTDISSRTPFSPYNLRLYRQTYYVLADVLRPLVLHGVACAAPMQRHRNGQAKLLEVCPASTLRAHGLSGAPYKGREPSHASRRRRIVQWVEEMTPARIPPAIQSAAVSDPDGNALDSLIAATAAFRARATGYGVRTHDPAYRLEGYVYL